MADPRKLSFQDVWNTAAVFFVDKALEQEIEDKVESLLETARDKRVSPSAPITEADIAAFLVENDNALEVILKDIGLSEEKFMRIISLLRRLNKIPGGFDSEWGIRHIKGLIKADPVFTQFIAKLLVGGKYDKDLQTLVPRYYLETLNYREIRGGSEAARRVHYKNALIGTYGGRKGYKVEGLIRAHLDNVQTQYGIGYEKGRSRFVETDLDFAIPSLEDPWVLVMSSFQETTSSGQTIKAKDMLSVYERVNRINSRHKEDRAFVNFVDGGGWLARKSDLERLVEQCHYFLNLHYLSMLESIILKHMPRKYFRSSTRRRQTG
jgi:hypothetical protein